MILCVITQQIRDNSDWICAVLYLLEKKQIGLVRALIPVELHYARYNNNNNIEFKVFLSNLN